MKINNINYKINYSGAIAGTTVISFGRIVLTTICIFILFVSCRKVDKDDNTPVRNPSITAENNLILGSLDAPIDQQFGRPVFVRTDDNGYIYVADEASMNIKVFNYNGEFLKNIGGRGRGPSEFLDLRMMEFDPDGNIVLGDASNLRFMVLSNTGDPISIYPFTSGSLLRQFLPAKVIWDENSLIGLQRRVLSASSLPSSDDFIDELFWVYSFDFQDSLYSFGSYRSLGSEYEHPVAINEMNNFPGSVDISKDRSKIIYSPGIYNGKLILFEKNDQGRWGSYSTIFGQSPWNEMPYKTFSSFDSADITPDRLNFGGELYYGRIMSMNGGVFFLDDRKIVHFYTEWRPGVNITLDHLDNFDYELDLFVQVFDENGKLLDHSYLLSIDIGWIPPINWMDKYRNFYLIRYDNRTVERFEIHEYLNSLL